MSTALALSVLLQAGAVAHEFVYRADREYKSVYVAGSFNGWSTGAWPMNVDADKRTWRRKADLSPGRHYYKFVIEGGTWITDPKAVKNVDDGSGNMNSVLDLLPRGFEKPAAKGDGVVTIDAVAHSQEAPWVNLDRGSLSVQLQARANDVAQVYANFGGKRVPMKPVAGDDLFTRYQASVPWSGKQPVRYYFELADSHKAFTWHRKGVAGTPSPFIIDPKTFKPIVVPGWVERTVMYQVFPERFENGDTRNDPPNTYAWDAEPTYYSFHGGDLAGIKKRMGHLKELGIGLVYFNPLFEGPSNHHYETFDYYKVDHRMGTNSDLADLTQSLKKLGIRTVLDGVFNHSGTGFAPFADVVKNGQASRYTDWFFFKSFPVQVKDPPNYEAFYNFPSLPSVNLLNADASAYMLKVPGYWKRTIDMDGWRLDTAQDAPMAFWRRFRNTVKGLGKDMWILGENWGDSSPWLKGDQWDAAMNYPFRDAVLHFVAMGDISASEFLKRLVANYNLYVPQVSRNMMNLLSSHDVPRFLTLCEGDRELAKLGAAIQFGWAGTPSVYYGEELGMEGGRDPDNRRGMKWSLATPKNDLLKTYKALIAARNGSRALQSGDPVSLSASDADQTVAFARVLGDEMAVVAANRSNSPRNLVLNLSGKAPSAAYARGFEDVLGGRRVAVSSKGSLTVRLGPKSAAFLVPARPRSAASSRPSRPDPVARNRKISQSISSRVWEAQ